MQASDLLTARNTLTQRSIGPRSTPTVAMDLSALKAGDAAGLALFNRPYAWLGVTVDERGARVAHVTEEGGEVAGAPLAGTRVWLRAECDFLTEEAQFSYSTDGRTFERIGAPVRLVFQLMTFQGVRYALFAFNTAGDGGVADFDRIDVHEPNPRGFMRPIPLGRDVELATHGLVNQRRIAAGPNTVTIADAGTPLAVVDRRRGRVALRSPRGFISVAPDGRVSLSAATPGTPETFQWIETFTGELTLLSLATHRYLRADPGTGTLRADSPGPHPNRRDGVRWEWRLPVAPN
jgi:hypothetical protein